MPVLGVAQLTRSQVDHLPGSSTDLATGAVMLVIHDPEEGDRVTAGIGLGPTGVTFATEF